MKIMTTICVCLFIMNICNAATKAYPTQDGGIYSDGTVNSAITTVIDVGTGSTGKNAEFAFTLPVLPEGQQFATAQFSVRFSIYNSMSVDADLYGIEYRTTNSISAADYYRGVDDPSDKATMIQPSFCSASDSSTEGRRTSTNDLMCAEFLNAQYKKSLAERNAGETITVFFRINPVAQGKTYAYFRLRPKESSTNNYYWPYILYTTEDIPSGGTVITIQ